jgi:5-methylcytosine-specific restriction endonuclease McrA
MRKIDQPEFSAAEVFSTCISKVRNKDLKKRFQAVIPYITSAEEKYRKLATESKLYTFRDELCSNTNVTLEEMKAVYTQRMANSGGPGYETYNALKRGTINRTCPICGQRKVSTLDHYLPKTSYPSVVVTPINLIPACSDCNKIKLDDDPQTSEEETLHPYFDDLGSDRFLFAEIIKDNPPVVNFYIHPPVEWDKVLTEKVKNHFDSFKLNLLYSIHAIDEIVGQAEYWKQLNTEDLKDQLALQAESRRKAHPNSWQTAFYEGASQDDWFCSEGYKKFIE